MVNGSVSHWGGRDGWLTLALVMDCHTRQLLGWRLSRSGKATTPASALEQALTNRYGNVGASTDTVSVTVR